MHQCQCGGVIRQHELTNKREAWTCNHCGRYQVLDKPKDSNPSTNTQNAHELRASNGEDE